MQKIRKMLTDGKVFCWGFTEIPFRTWVGICKWKMHFAQQFRPSIISRGNWIKRSIKITWPQGIGQDGFKFFDCQNGRFHPTTTLEKSTMLRLTALLSSVLASQLEEYVHSFFKSAEGERWEIKLVKCYGISLRITWQRFYWWGRPRERVSHEEALLRVMAFRKTAKTDPLKALTLRKAC